MTKKIDIGQLLVSFDNYAAEVTDALSEVRQFLERGEYPLACKAMTAISSSQARTSTGIRASLIKAGLLEPED